MTSEGTPFGPELRRLRIAADLSVSELARLLHYSKSHVSKVETGLQRPTPELARRCDALLGAAGTLAALVPVQATGTALTRQTTDSSAMWSLNVAPDGTSSFRLVDRRTVLVAGPASMLSLGFSDRDVSAAARQAAPIEVFRAQFDQFRQLGQTASPALVLPALIAQTQTVQGVAQSGSGPRGPALALAARYAEYTGWMCQEAGNDDAALWWTDRAVELDSARVLLAAAPADSATPVLGSTTLTDPVAMITGWCLYDLGRPAQAAGILDREIARLPPHALRAGTRYGVRRALCHAAAGEVEHACEITETLLGGVEVVGSATIRADLRRLARTLSRFGSTTSVRALSPRLTASLAGPPADPGRSTPRA